MFFKGLTSSAKLQDELQLKVHPVLLIQMGELESKLQFTPKPQVSSSVAVIV